MAPLRPSNCGFLADWSPLFRDRFEGQPLKNVALSFEGATARGDVVLTRGGLEGGAVYALSAPLRDAVARNGAAELRIALRPDIAAHDLERRLGGRAARQSLSTALRKALNLTPAAIGLLHEALLRRGERLAELDPRRLAALINAVPVRLVGTAPLARAISTAGGVALDGIDPHGMLAARPGTFVAGEMVDWEAPTGGYLLQASFATGAGAGRGRRRLAFGKHPDGGRHDAASDPEDLLRHSG